jgi:hypothetical protein
VPLLFLFLVHHPVNGDDWHLLAHAMAYDFTVARQSSQREQLVFLLRIKLLALIRLGVSPHRNLRTRRRMHLCMQDNQTGPKIMGLAPADMARLPSSINPTKIF